MPGLSLEEARQRLLELPDEALQLVQLSVPWQMPIGEQGTVRDGDGFTVGGKRSPTFNDLQTECWSKFHLNPQVNTAIRGLIGRLAGWGFECTSGVWEIQEIIEQIEQDWRNRLYTFWPKYVGRTLLDGELYLCLTLHPDGFVEVDYVDPVDLDPGTGEDGIIWHPGKTCMPLFYTVNVKSATQQITKVQIPSVYIAKYPELIAVASTLKGYNTGYQKDSRSRRNIYNKFGGYKRFIVSWDRGLVTKRAISYLITTLQWLNHYENLKKYEIDHKKSAGAYLWVINMEDTKAFRLWLSMTEAEREKTGLMAKKSPGGTLVLPPGMKMSCINPSLTSIKDQDTDIMHMITSGLNEPEDVSTGATSGTFASVKATRGPMSDRTSDELAYFDRFLKFDFWAAIFFLRATIGKMPETYTVKMAVDFESKKPKFKDIKRRPEQLIEISYPISETVDFEGRARAHLGVKHGPLAETLGMNHKEIARRMGIGGYAVMRLRKATEDDKYPELKYNVDAETLQEKTNSNPNKGAPTPGKPVLKPPSRRPAVKQSEGEDDDVYDD